MTPIYISITLIICACYIYFKNGKSVKLDATNTAPTLGVLFGASIAFGGLVSFFMVPWLRRRFENDEKLHWYQAFYIWMLPPQPKDEELENQRQRMLTHESSHSNGKGSSSSGAIKESTVVPEGVDPSHPNEYDDDDEVPLYRRFYRGLVKFLTYGVNQDAVLIRSRKVRKIHAKCIKFENRTEQLFSIMQLFTCSLASFAHGANDIANSTTPLASKCFLLLLT